MTRQQLIQQIFEKKSFLCVGLDPDLKKIPPHILESVRQEMDGDEENNSAEALAICVFNKFIIDATAPYCVAYKPNLAFYEALGSDGIVAYENTVEYIRQNYPNHFIIADAS